MAHEELEFTRAPRENLQTYHRVKKIITTGVVATVVVLLILAAWLV